MKQSITEDAIDDLSTPLGQHLKRKPPWLRYRPPFILRQMLAVLLGLVLLTFLGYAIFNDDPLGGEPTAKVGPKPDAAKTADNNTTLTTSLALTIAKPPPAAEQKTVTIIDGSSGARRDVTVPSSDTDAPAPSSPAMTIAKPPPATEQKTVTIVDGSSGARRDVTVPSSDTDAPAPPPGMAHGTSSRE